MIKVHIDYQVLTNETHIWITKELPSGEVYFANPMQLIFQDEPHDYSKDVLPTLSLKRHAATEFLQGLSSALQEAGYKEKSASVDNSDLKYHLEDMRRLVFKSKK